ncbi:MAG: hydantoinase B/oxoprolinase family protein [Lautropia sp.]
MKTARRPVIDVVSLELTRNRLSAIANEMAIAVQKSAYSTNIKTRRDFSCAIFDARGRAVAQSFSQPVHLGSLSHFVPRIIEHVRKQGVRPGDAWICNDGYRGGVHLNDVCVVAPVHVGKRLVAYVANLAHHLDVGGSTPGSMVGYSTEILHEGLRIPPTRLMRDRQMDVDVIALIANNVRAPRETSGDLRAQVAGLNVGESRITELVAKLGADGLARACDEILAYTERRVRAGIRDLPAGTYRAEDYMDGDGNSDEPVKVVVTVRIGRDQVVFDLTGSDPQRRGPINATYAMSLSCCAYALRVLLANDIPSNDGFYRVCKVVAPAGTVVNATFPAPIGGGWETGNRVTETAMRALAQAVPERLAAGSKGCFSNIAFGGVSPRDDGYFMFYETVCGGYGGRAARDGVDGVQAHGQNTENSPIEETEVGYPVEIVRYGLIPDSEGAGRHRGGLGVRRDYRFEFPITFSVLADRSRFAPWGLAGGGEGRPVRLVLDPDIEGRTLPSKVSVELRQGQIFSVQMAGGGGYGPAWERDAARVAQDVKDERLSVDRARDAYGVVLDPRTGAVDEAGTRRLRGRMRRRAAPRP